MSDTFVRRQANLSDTINYGQVCYCVFAGKTIIWHLHMADTFVRHRKFIKIAEFRIRENKVIMFIGVDRLTRHPESPTEV